jgi:hypothetical protein
VNTESWLGGRSTPAELAGYLVNFCWRIALAASLLATPALGQTIAPCKVIDPELQWTYTGGCKDGLAEGYGEATGIASYRGEFKAGRKHGKGVKSWFMGERYEGDFVEDRREGTGMYVWGRFSGWSGQRYTGGYLNDQRHGYGVYEWPNGDRYAGPWVNDRFIGVPTKGMFARARTEAELAVAVGRVGAKICRQMEGGIGNRDIVRGTVLDVASENISIRIDDPGKIDHVIGGRPVTKGTVISDPLKFWVPCI